MTRCGTTGIGQHERTRWDDFEQREKNRWETTEESIALCFLRWGGIDKTQQQMSNQMDIECSQVMERMLKDP
jgi:hypothetical protein